jgi:site-specific DNA-methyltransferase (adenine-specific)
MRYLVRLVTPPGGLVLDPFTGSGSTGKAAVLEGMRFIGCELSPEYSAIAEARIKAAAVKTGQVFDIPASPAPGRKAEGEQLRLFA